MELLWTARDVGELAALRGRLDAMPDSPITQAEWRRALHVFGELAAAGPLHHRRVKLPDLLIAATAELVGVPSSITTPTSS